MNFPKTASVNAPDTITGLIDVLRDHKVVPECESFDVGMANNLATLASRAELGGPIYCNILLGSRGAADLSVLNLAAIIASLPVGTTWALAGIVGLIVGEYGCRLRWKLTAGPDRVSDEPRDLISVRIGEKLSASVA